jgi:LPXTG-motif cell wall-anchored protein
VRATTARLAALIVGLALTSTFTAGIAGAEQPESSPAPTSETSVPVSEPPASSEPSTPPSESAPSEPPSTGEPPASVAAAQVEVSAKFDQPSYKTGEPLSIDFSIKNVGSARATGLYVFSSTLEPARPIFDPPLVGGVFSKPGVDLEPGATHQVTLPGRVLSPDEDHVTFAGVVFDETNFGVAEFSVNAPVERRTVRVGGVVYGDQNGNGRRDAGEELPGITLTWTNVDFFDKKYTATTDADGRFTFAELPTVRYLTGAEVVDGWLFPYVIREIDASDENENLLIRAVPPLDGALHATLKFTKNSYAPGELAHLEVTLSNSGPIPLRGIIAGCNRVGNSNGLNTGPGWGDLAFGTDGVTIGVGKTRTFEVTEHVPQAAFDYGYVFASCDFGYLEVDIDNHATADDQAAVPGALATLEGRVFTDQSGEEGLGGVKLVLVRDGPCPVVGETTTGTDGRFRFEQVPPGPDYKVYFLPPTGWRMVGDNPTSIQVIANGGGRPGFLAERGDAALPTVPTNPSTCTTTTTPPATTPAPQGRSSSGLASTGANVTGLAALGVMALLLGAGTIVAARRRRARPTG